MSENEIKQAKIEHHDFLRVTCKRCDKIVLAMEDTTPEKNATTNIKTETGVTVVFICESCKGVGEPAVFFLPKPLDNPLSP